MAQTQTTLQPIGDGDSRVIGRAGTTELKVQTIPPLHTSKQLTLEDAFLGDFVRVRELPTLFLLVIYKSLEQVQLFDLSHCRRLMLPYSTEVDEIASKAHVTIFRR